ncbi:MAG: MFS transporter [Bacteroidota bacterium]|jgi:MFS family permease
MIESSGRWDRRNFLLNVFEGAFYVTGSSLISSQTVLPALVARLGGGNMAVGALGVINWMGVLLPQVFASRHGQTLEWKKPWIVKYGGIQRLLILVIGVILLVPFHGQWQVTLAIFFGLFALNQLILGATSPVWFDFFAKLIGRTHRGRSFGLRSALAGIMSLGGSILLTFVLKTYDFPVNFTLIFLLAFVFEMLSLVMQSYLIEETPSKIIPRQSLKDYFLTLAGVLRQNVGFRRFLTATAFSILATMPLGFFTVYALKSFRLGESSVGIFTLAMVGGQIVGAPAIGYLADRFSNKVALVATSIAMLAAIVTALIVPSPAWYRIVFVFLGVNIGSELMIRYNFAIEYCPVEHRSMYIGLMNTLLGPCYLCGLIGGWLSNSFGYGALFAISGACSLVGVIFLLVAVHEPYVSHHLEASFGRPEETVVPG